MKDRSEYERNKSKYDIQSVWYDYIIIFKPLNSELSPKLYVLPVFNILELLTILNLSFKFSSLFQITPST